MTTDLTARIAELASRIEAHLVDDHKAADLARRFVDDWTDLALGLKAEDADADAAFPHIDRNSPARTFRRVKATRDLVAGILAEQHQNVDGDPWFSCSQAVYEHGGEPGSACADDERAGKPCDCGRDEHVVKMLAIIASEWEE